MTTLHVLLPALATLSDGAWRRWLARADGLPVVPDARNAAIRKLLRFPGDTLPVAALRHHACADATAAGTWACADPAWVRSEATGARLMACPLDDLAASDAAALAAGLQPLLGDAGMPLAVDAPNAWCVRLADGAPLPKFTEPAAALGVALLECLPEGDVGRRWRRLFNEVQIALHAHPVNAARLAAGQHPVNALWFWGAGPLPHGAATDLQWIASHDDRLRGLAKLAGIRCLAPQPGVLHAPDAQGEGLLDLGDAATPADWPAWLALFQQTLREAGHDVVELTFASGEGFRARHAHRLRFWRRA